MSIENVVNSIKRKDSIFNFYISVLDGSSTTVDGPLSGIPIAIKDIVYTNGIRTTAGSNVLRDFVPNYDASIVEKIRKAGGVIIGKTNCHEFAAGPTNTSLAFGPAKNPHNPELITGGSSGGSAGTVAIGDVPVSIGTDTGGSVRIPAALCGIIGFKPTFGRISRFGIIPLAWSHDTVGIFGRKIKTVASMYRLLKGYDPRDDSTIINAFIKERTRKIKKIGIITNLTHGTETEDVFRGYIDTIASSYDLVDVTIPELDKLNDIRFLLTNTECAAYHQRFRDKIGLYGSDLLEIIRTGSTTSGLDYINAQRIRAALATKVIKYFDNVDLLVCPTVPILPPKISDVIGRESTWRPLLTKNTAPFNMVGLPSISLPINKYVGVQLVAKLGEDELLLNLSSDVMHN